jgi:hypothetical protein
MILDISSDAFDRITNRVFIFCWPQPVGSPVHQATVEVQTLTLPRLIQFATDNNDPFEFALSAADNLDAILDLNVGETMDYYGSRDDKRTKGFVTRIQ